MALFEIDENSSIPIWVQMKNRLIFLITSGYYKTGQQLPTVRGLSADAGVNYNTVNKVYKSLEADGYIETRLRQGAFVADISGRPGLAVDTTVDSVTREYFKRCQELGLSLDDVERQFDIVLREMRAKIAEGEHGGQANNEATGNFIEFDSLHQERGVRYSS